MDHAKIEWDYEPQGFKLDTTIGGIKYLPDFLLPDIGQWVEVKGHLELTDCRRLCAIAVAMCQCDGGNDLAVLGEIPKHGSRSWPIQLHAHDGKLFAAPWDLAPDCPLARPHIRIEPTDKTASVLTRGILAGIPEWAEEPVQAARSARFEWGESG